MEHAGFDIVFTSGYSLAASTLGMPDIGLLTASEVLDRVRNIATAVSIPVIADMDTGYGNPLNVVRTVRECVAAGVAGIILEDQEWPKKCGHMEGKRVIPREEHVQKIRAAVAARGDSGLVLIGRTDARAVVGLDDAIERGKAYRDAGADIVFVEAPQSLEELQTIARAIPDAPLFANMIEGGVTPVLTATELEELGFKMVVFPLSPLYAAAAAVQEVAKRLKTTGTTAGSTLLPFGAFNEIVDVPGWRELEQEYVT
jgi:methylisocitrate lyase